MSKKLLLADDSVTIQKVVELILTDEDFEIRSVNDGEEAWSAVKEYMPDIILADIEMPRMNGYQLCERVKNDEMTAHIPVILLAGAYEPIDEELARSVGADDYIIKPFESHELMAKLSGALEEEAVAEGLEEAYAEEEEVVMAASEDTGAAPETAAMEAAAVAAEEPAAAETAETAPEKGEEEEEEEVWVGEDLTLEPSEETWGLEEELNFDDEAEALEAIEEPLAEETGGEPAVGEEEAVKERPAVEVPLPSPEEMRAIAEEKISELVNSLDRNEFYAAFTSAVEKNLKEALGSLDIQGIIADNVSSIVRSSMEGMVAETAPGLISEALKGVMDDMSGSLREQIERIIWETVPELAETIITREVERIKSAF